MLEREPVLAAIADLQRRARSGHGRALFIVSGPGLGKTACLDLAARLAGRDLRVAMARGDPMEMALPFGVLGQLLESMGAGEVLREPTNRRDQADAHRIQLFRVLRRLETGSSPVLLIVDDLHWSDPDSLSVLSFLCRRLRALPVAVLAAIRPWPPGAEDAALNLVQGGHADVQHLGELSDGASMTLLQSRAPSIPDELVGQVARLGAGNPLLLEQLALEASAGMRVPDDAQQWASSAAHSLLLWRFAGMPPPAVRCAQAGSVFGNRFRADIAADVGRLDDAEMDVALESLCRSGLVRSTQAGALEFAHPLFRQAVYENLPAPLQQLMHRRAFGSLRRRGMEAEAAVHAASGRMVGDPEAVDALVTAAREAMRLGANATAVQHLEAGVELAAGHAGAELMLALGEALLAAGQPLRAAATYQRTLLTPGLTEAARLRALRMRGRALFMSGDWKRAMASLDAAAGSGAGEPVEMARALLDHVHLAWVAEGPRAALPIAERARQASHEAGAEMALRGEVAWGFTSLVAGNPDGIDASGIERKTAAESWIELADGIWNCETLLDAGRLATFTERFDRAREIISLALEAAEREGSPEEVATAYVLAAESSIRLGSLEEAAAFAARARSLGETAPMAQSLAGVAEAHALLLLGRPEEAEGILKSSEASIARGDQWLACLWMWHIRGMRLLGGDDPAAAADLYGRIESVARRLGVGEPCVVPWGRHAALAHARCGQPDRALRVVESLEGSVGRLPCRWPAAAAAAGRAAVHDLAGRVSEADRAYRGALEVLDTLPLPIERIQVLVEHGSFLRRRGARTRARAALTAALRLAEDLGASWLATQARDALIAAAGRPGRRRPAPGTLTLQEERVARLAAAGDSNSEIARRLSISAKTVDTHLMRVFAKLSIHSRRQLMIPGRLSQREEPQERAAGAR